MLENERKINELENMKDGKNNTYSGGKTGTLGDIEPSSYETNKPRQGQPLGSKTIGQFAGSSIKPISVKSRGDNNYNSNTSTSKPLASVSNASKAKGMLGRK